MVTKIRDTGRDLTDADRVAWRALQTMPNVGPAIARDLLRLGIRRPEDLAGQNPDALYDELALLDGAPSDPCVRDVFTAVVEYAETGQPVPWWHFTPDRKAREGK
jgi:hypothetical protein